MPPGSYLSIMELFRPWRPGRVLCCKVACVSAHRGGAGYRGLRHASCAASRGIFMKSLYLLLAIILLHDIFAPHPFTLSVTLSCGNLSVQAFDEEHPSAADFSENDENTSVPSQRGTLMPVLSVKLNNGMYPFFHPLLTIAADERPPKA